MNDQNTQCQSGNGSTSCCCLCQCCHSHDWEVSFCGCKKCKLCLKMEYGSGCGYQTTMPYIPYVPNYPIYNPPYPYGTHIVTYCGGSAHLKTN